MNKDLTSKMNRIFKLVEKIKEQKKVVAKEVTKLEKLQCKQGDLEEVVLNLLNQNGLESADNRYGEVKRSPVEHFNIVDYESFCGYLHKHKAYDLLQKRLSKAAYLDRVNDGKKVPGVKKTVINRLKVRVYK